MEIDREELLQSALLSATLIGPVVPIYGIGRNVSGALVCTCGGKDGCRPGKHPILKRWQQLATSDSDTIREWLTERFPGANYGVPTGPNPLLDAALIVVDADIKDGVNGLASIDQEAFDSGEPLPTTITVATGGGGQHWYYLAPDGYEITNRANFLPGVDLRGAGGYVLGAGSHYYSGTTYHYLEECGPDEQQIAACPFLMPAPCALEHNASSWPRPATSRLRLPMDPGSSKLANSVPHGAFSVHPEIPSAELFQRHTWLWSVVISISQ